MNARASRGERAAMAAFAALVSAYAVWVAFVLDGPRGPRVGFGPDSALYVDAAAAPPWSRDFLSAPGPFMFLLLVKASLRNLRAVVLVQSLLYAGAFAYLAWTVRTVLTGRVASTVGFAGVLLLGLSPRALQWNAFIAVESLSITLLCTSLALGLRVAAGARGRTVWLFAGALVGFGFTRDTNALVLGALAGVLAVAAIAVAGWRRVGAGLAAACVATALTAMVLSNHARPPRWLFPLTETVALRIVPDAGAREFFVDRGLPVDPAVVALHQNFFVLATELRAGATYAPLRAWVREEGRQVYTAYLASHPRRLLGDPIEERRRLVVPDVEGYGRFPEFRNAPPAPYRWMGSLAWPPWVGLGELWLLAAGAGLGWLVLRHRAPPVALTLLAAGALGWAGFSLAYHGDALEVDRHAITYAVQLRVVAWTGLALVAGSSLRACDGPRSRGGRSS